MGVTDEPTHPGSAGWRAAEVRRLLAFAAASAADVGFAWLDADGAPRATDERELWINARMTYVFSDAHRRGLTGTAGLAGHGVTALLHHFRDPVHDGWFRTVGAGGPLDDVKACYEHAFVVLAGCAASDAGVEGGEQLRDAALAVHEQRFWDPTSGRCYEQWSRDWSTLDPYRGANSNMHTVEAYLAAARSTGDPVWLARAASIAHGVVGVASAYHWRVVEHFDDAWRALPDYNRDRPRDPFRPFGSTPGHGFEWARLLLQLDDALRAAGTPDDGLVVRAYALFDRAVRDTGGFDNRTGLPYTTDWDGHPVVTERFHWVLCEALLAVDAVAARRADDPRWPELRERWWRLADDHFVDREHGSWRHELGADLEPSSRTWSGKPDVYHAYNACVLARP